MTDKKLADKEIIQTLNRCSKGIGCFGCAKAYMHSANCIRVLEAECLDLINCQKSEIEKLKSNYSKLCKYTEKKELELAEINADVSWFREAKISRLAPAIKEIKAEAYAEACKEFADKLKKKCYEDFEETDEMLAPYVTEDNIDEVLKQMVSEEIL